MATKMTPKGFLKKLNSKAAASALCFLSKYREYLTSGDLAETLQPIVEKLDSGELLPTPALSEIRQAVMSHIIAVEAAKAEKAIARANTPARGSSKAFQAVILNQAGLVQTYVNNQGEVKELRQNFKLPQEAERWCDRRLFDYPHCYGEVLHHGSPWETIGREDSIARILKRPKGAVIKRSPTPGKLSGQIKIRSKHQSFSQG